MIIGHRGSPGRLPDHTLEAYTLAVEQGADAIEPDLVRTRDGVLVARHENELGLTTDVASRFPGRKRVATVDGERVEGWFVEDFTFAELRTLRARQPWPDRPHDHDGKYLVPTFDEVLDLAARLGAARGRPVTVVPELKHSTHFRALGLPLEEPFVEALGVPRELLWAPEGPTGFVERARAAGLGLYVWTFRAERPGPAGNGDPVAEIAAFLRLGVDGVFADQPELAVAAAVRVAAERAAAAP